MDIYLVGGAVRDRLLGRDATEQDWVVVGATAEQLTARGFKQVGKDFPVFLHPKTGDEYALARTERKSGSGYTGFDVSASPDVSLEDDLRRRDLTVNAIAQAEDGTLIDPYGGQADIEARVLRHVSPAFVEDPLRVLRVARFAARFSSLGFMVADETLALMRQISASGELDALVTERVWRETQRALAGPTPEAYFACLREVGALEHILPEVDRLFGVPQPERWHPEIDTGVHTLMSVAQAASLSDDPCVRFAALCHDLGKAETPEAEWPAHHGHEARGEPLVRALAERLRVAKDYRDLAVLAAREHVECHRAIETRPKTVLALLERCDAFRRPERFADLLHACHADLRGRTGLEDRPYPQRAILLAALESAKNASRVDDMEGLVGPEIAEQVRRQRLQAIAASLAVSRADMEPGEGY